MSPRNVHMTRDSLSAPAPSAMVADLFAERVR